MPDVNTHCEISKERTGNDFKELHEWIDEPTKFLGVNHRIERHSFHEGYKDYVKSKWGEKAIVEWLFHIALDNLETANKYAVEFYNKAFAGISIEFKDKEISSCSFIKNYPNSKSIISYNKEKLKEIIKFPEKRIKFTKEELELMGFDEIEAEVLSN